MGRAGTSAGRGRWRPPLLLRRRLHRNARKKVTQASRGQTTSRRGDGGEGETTKRVPSDGSACLFLSLVLSVLNLREMVVLWHTNGTGRGQWGERHIPGDERTAAWLRQFLQENTHRALNRASADCCVYTWFGANGTKSVTDCVDSCAVRGAIGWMQVLGTCSIVIEERR